MTLQAAIEAELPFLRTEAEALMSLTLTAYSPNGMTTDGDGYEVPAFTSEGTTPGKVQGGSSATKDTVDRYLTIGSVERPVLEGGLHIPISSPVPVAGNQRGIGWEYVVTSVGDLADMALLEKRFLVVNVPVKSFATARRLDVVEVEA